MKKYFLFLAVVLSSLLHAQPGADALAGAFSVSESTQVYFAKGNLRYTQSTKTWSFAEHQYDMLGIANVSGGKMELDGYGRGYYTRVDAAILADTIDLFGFSASTGAAKWGISTSKIPDDYFGDFMDWGKNTIGTNAPNTYRTLTKNE